MRTHTFEEIIEQIGLCESLSDVSMLAKVLNDEREYYDDEELADLILKLKNKADLLTLSDMSDNSVFFLFRIYDSKD